MTQSSTRSEGRNWDIARVDRDHEGPAGVAAWTETYAPRVLGFALTKQPEFIEHVERVRAGEDVWLVAAPYIRRDQGQRLELVAAYLERAAEPDPWTPSEARMRVWNIAARAWTVGGPLPDPASPARAIRDDAAETIALGALRVARRGARRCCALYCSPPPGSQPRAGLGVPRRPSLGVGELLAPGRVGDYCAACAAKVTKAQHARFLEAERRMFDAAIPVVLGGDSRPRARRQHRAAAHSRGSADDCAPVARQSTPDPQRSRAVHSGTKPSNHG